MERLPIELQEDIYQRVHKMHFKDISDHLIAHAYMFYFNHLFDSYVEQTTFVFGVNRKEQRGYINFRKQLAVNSVVYTDAQEELINALMESTYPETETDDEPEDGTECYLEDGTTYFYYCNE